MFMAHATPAMHPSDHNIAAARGILELCAGLPIALSVTGEAVYERISSGVGFDFACKMYFKELCDEMNPGASILDSAIRLSLATLKEKLKRGAGDNRIHELYSSLCVFQNQQFVPVHVLSLVWNTTEVDTSKICSLFGSMSLTTLSTRTLEDGGEECGLQVHDLHLQYCCQTASGSGDEKEWHRRLLDGHIPPNTFLDEDGGSLEDNVALGLNMLEYEPRPWWKNDIANPVYFRKNPSKDLRGARLDIELGATVLDLRWIDAQALAGGVLGLMNDFDNLEEAVKFRAVPEVPLEPSATNVLDTLKYISEELVSQASFFGQGFRPYCYMLCTGLLFVSQTNEFCRRFLERVKAATPKPFLFSTLSLYEPPGKAFTFSIDLQPVSEHDQTCLAQDFAICDEYVVAGVHHGVVVQRID